MNHSERLALDLVAKTRAMMAEPHAIAWDWSTTIMLLSLATLVFLFILLSSE